MSSTSNRMVLGRKWIKPLAAVLFGLAVFGVLRGQAAAAPPVPGNTLPKASDFSQTSSMYLIVAKYGGNYVLDAPTSVTRVYSKQSTVTLNVIDGRHCPNNGPDRGPGEGEAGTQTTFTLAQLAPRSDAAFYSDPQEVAFPGRGGSTEIRTSSQMSCGGSYSITIQGSPAGKSPDDSPMGDVWANIYGFELEANMTGGLPGWNMFKLQLVTPGWLSYYAGSGDKFGVKADGGSAPYPGTTGTYRFGFAPSCKLKPGQTIQRQLKWFDADIGEPNQPGAITSTLFEFNQAGQQTQAWNVPITQGDSQPGAFSFQAQGSRKYEWVIRNIYSANGWQFELPYDSYSTLINFNNGCEPDYRYSCTVSPASVTGLDKNQQVQVSVTVKNMGGAPWDPSASPTIQLARYINNNANAVNYKSLSLVTNNPVPKNGTVTFVFNDSSGLGYETAPSSFGATKTITYKMYRSGVGNMALAGPQCQAKLTTKPAPGNPPPVIPSTPYLEVLEECRYLTVQNVNVSAKTTYGGLAQPSRISNVPVAIQVWNITDPANPFNEYTYVLPKGVPNYNPNDKFNTGFSFPINIFKEIGKPFGDSGPRMMFPTRNYQLRLFVQGFSPADQVANYPDNGSWNPSNDPNQGGYYYSVNGPFNDTFGDPLDVVDCLQGTEEICVGPSIADIEPGQTEELQYTISFNNRTAEEFETNNPDGYNFKPIVEPGLFYVGGIPPESSLIEQGPNVNVNVSLPIRQDYTGRFWIQFLLKTEPVSMPVYGWDNGTCGDPNNPGDPGEPGTDTPRTRPYFQVGRGDVQTGGAFKNAGSCPSDNSYASPITRGYDYAGGIRAFGTPRGSPPLGSLAEFGALSLGLIADDPESLIGFGAKASFANMDIPPGGVSGYLNSNAPAYCATDYWQLKESASLPAFPGDLAAVAQNGQYQQNGDLVLAGGSLPAERRITLFVEGNVTITGDITLPAKYDPTDPEKIPYFTLVVKGNIHVDSQVKRLDGLYVAQPTAANTDGQFWSCTQGTFCKEYLNVNGAVIARQILPLRSHGTLSNDAVPQTYQLCASYPCSPAEFVSYVPLMLIGRPFLQPESGGIESYFSLPPVF